MKNHYFNKLTLYKFKEENEVRKLYVIALISLLIVSGCGMNKPKTDEDKIAEELNPTRNKDSTIDPEWEKRLGYVNYTKDQFDDEPDRDEIRSEERRVGKECTCGWGRSDREE